MLHLSFEEGTGNLRMTQRCTGIQSGPWGSRITKIHPLGATKKSAVFFARIAKHFRGFFAAGEFLGLKMLRKGMLFWHATNAQAFVCLSG
jgi:hypothetical protein